MSNIIRFNLPNEVYNTLKYDTHLFEYKSLNALMNKVTKNYLSTYLKSTLNAEVIHNILNKHLLDISKDKSIQIYNDISRKIMINPLNDSMKSISFLETMVSKKVLESEFSTESIEYNYPKSIIIRDMLISYANSSLIEREKIIFKDIISDLKKAINKSLMMTIKTSDKRREIQPYAIKSIFTDYGLLLFGFSESDKKIILISIRLILDVSISTNTFGRLKNISKKIEEIIPENNPIMSNDDLRIIEKLFDPVFRKTITQVLSSIPDNKQSTVQPKMVKNLLRLGLKSSKNIHFDEIE